MNKKKARIILLEQAVLEAQYVAQFLHDCLTKPKDCKYAHPEQTLKNLNEWRKLVPPPPMCVHSGPVEGCRSCEEGHKHRRERTEALKTLGLKDD